jgi:probable HAF family extracellular repeat protein
MRRTFFIVPLWTVVVLICGSTHTLGAVEYVLTDLGNLGGGLSIGYGINNSGQVTGYSYLTGDIGARAFLNDGSNHPLDSFGGSFNAGYAINNKGQITGTSELPGNVGSRAFFYDGVVHDIGEGAGYGINDNGVIVGGAGHAFYYDGAMHDLGIGVVPSSGLGINSQGWVTGYAGDQAFLYDGNVHYLGTLGGTTSVGRAINAAG